MAQTVKNLPAMEEIWVWSLGLEDPLEEDMATHFSVLAQTEKPGGLQSMGSQRVGHWAINTLLFSLLSRFFAPVKFHIILCAMIDCDYLSRKWNTHKRHSRMRLVNVKTKAFWGSSTVYYAGVWLQRKQIACELVTANRLLETEMIGISWVEFWIFIQIMFHIF